ncbi:hypothetical protein MBM_06164 [Drepanopeziza brunnea f. sp. 'multigermtubi' MB_m1]|uniref:Uncharacterized protein n=1 Tax=Marssonina brunnea f. sp. multigermtubi (strain MB_m1) TaxID=1072389 RepID=K1WR81_MARBU|nr:uncharacterized protein MBM_06164 [Drepanopeziza brunnea f. sp. 'multigermtubi' MB_m1]EKD15536.1 hypothetical protein MBM_06164 [Drepanopeziza brunnea f. sp. 'multigermtubi' MB_m1]
MPPLAKSICAILLAVSFLFDRARGFPSGGTRVTIGYRTEEAELINFLRQPFRDREYDEEADGLNQLGHGFYMINEPAGWPGRPLEDNWFCVIKADGDKVKNAAKIYIPERYSKLTWNARTEEVYLWAGEEETVLEYIESMIPNPERALRFSWIVAGGSMQQMVIPSDIINYNELDMWAQCFQTAEELYRCSSEIIDWKSWEITGNPGIPGSANYIQPDF